MEGGVRGLRPSSPGHQNKILWRHGEGAGQRPAKMVCD